MRHRIVPNTDAVGCAEEAPAGTARRCLLVGEGCVHGKNVLWDTVLSLFPEEMVIRRSGISAKALFRTEARLKGAVLYLQEVAGSEDADLLRSWQKFVDTRWAVPYVTVSESTMSRRGGLLV